MHLLAAQVRTSELAVCRRHYIGAQKLEQVPPPELSLDHLTQLTADGLTANIPHTCTR